MSGVRPLRILLVEDDDALAAGLSEALGLEGYRVERAATLAAADRLFEADPADPPGLVILDLMLPDGSGLGFLKRARARRPALPVLILSAKSGELDRVVGLELGADDFVAKPFSLRELTARIRALLRRCAPQEAGEAPDIALGALLVRPAAREASVAGRAVNLSYTEFELLLALLARRGAAVTREMLLDRIWSGDFVEPRSVDPHVSRLRRKLGPEGERIETVPGIGYRLRP